MEDPPAVDRYRSWYRRLLCLYSRPYRERFAESMEQTFHDLCRERADAGHGIFRFALWVFAETAAAILKDRVRSLMPPGRKILRIAFATACLLLVPLLGRAPWGVLDYAAAGTLLFGTGLTYELIARKHGTIAYRAAVAIACAAGLLLIWVNLAVGIIGSEDHPANLLYLGVLAVAVAGACIARLEARPMGHALFATALAQALVALVAIVAGWGLPETSPLEMIYGNGFFVALWLVGALLFRVAGDRPVTASSPSPPLET